MVSLTFYGGAGEIGGNKILLQDKGAKIYLDFGQSFDFGEDFFYEWLQPRSANGLEVYFEFGMMPKIPKLYKKDVLTFTKLKYQKSDIDAVFISHSHSDHMAHLQFLDENIPVYMGHGTNRLIEAYSTLFPSLVKVGEHNLHLFKSGDTVKVKHLEITPIHVDHSVPGAYGFIIKTSKGNIIYSGDLRMHGPYFSNTEEFIKKAAASKPIAMLCEGTRLEKEVEHNYTEDEVHKKVCEITKQAKGTVFAHFAMTNIDRFKSFYDAAVKNKRIMVISTKLAYILSSMKDKISWIPDVLTDKNIRVYYRLAGTCTFCEKDYRYTWEKTFLPNKITYKEINANPEKYVMQLGFNSLMELVYIQPEHAEYIYSSSEHFYEGEDNEEERTIWENWMSHFGIRFHKAHCSGHADREGIRKIVSEIKPKVTIPIHCSVPEEFRKLHNNIIVPKKGKTIEV